MTETDRKSGLLGVRRFLARIEISARLLARVWLGRGLDEPSEGRVEALLVDLGLAGGLLVGVRHPLTVAEPTRSMVVAGGEVLWRYYADDWDTTPELLAEEVLRESLKSEAPSRADRTRTRLE